MVAVGLMGLGGGGVIVGGSGCDGVAGGSGGFQVVDLG